MLVAVFVLCLIGSVESKMKPFVVDGENATDTQFTYAACLHIQCHPGTAAVQNKPGISWRCGSSIVNQYILLTAAHCVSPVICENVSIAVSVGSANRLKGIIASADRYKVHENYTRDLSHDIALVRLKRSLDFGPTISRVAIMQHSPHNEPAQIAGWGRTDAVKLKLTDALQYTCYTVMKKKQCLDIMENLPKGTFCARRTGHGYIFNGDSGSALVVKGYIQIGISSYLKRGSVTRVAVFTDVDYYYQWIVKNARNICRE